MFAYLVKVESKHALGFNKREALNLARKHEGARVYRIPYWLYKDGRYPYGWDVPTFIAQAERIYG